MEKKIIYLYPEYEGQQYFVCWEFANKKNTKIKELVLAGLNEIKASNNKFIKQRSFSVYLGQEADKYWVAVPRQLSAKAMKIIHNKLAILKPNLVITSLNNPFYEKLPFEPVISYDRGFIVDSSNIEEKMANSQKTEKIVNI